MIQKQIPVFELEAVLHAAGKMATCLEIVFRKGSDADARAEAFSKLPKALREYDRAMLALHEKVAP